MAYAQICQQEKVGEPVDFPIDGLDVRDYVKMDCKAEGVNTMYDLFAVTNHFGSLNGGHYTAFGKNPDGNWYDFNDSSVSRVSIESVQRAKSSAYLLFYRRREDPGASTQSTTADEESKVNTPDRRGSTDSGKYIYELD